MAKRRKSLLNAFNTANPKRVEAPRTPPPEPPRTAARAPLPRYDARADQAIPVRASAPVPTAPRRAGTHSELPAAPPPVSRARLLLLSIVGAVVLLAVVIALKFGQSGESGSGVTFANGPNGAPTQAPRSTPQATQTPAAARTESSPPKSAPAMLDPAAGSTDEDKAFKDAANKFTIRLLQYGNDANGLKLARDTYRYLRGENVPVVQPILSGDGAHIYVCADARPKKEDLVVLRDYLKRMRGPDGKSYPFRDAYVDNIDHVVSR